MKRKTEKTDNVLFLSLKECAEMLGVSESFLNKQKRLGLLKYYKFGKRVCVKKSDVLEYTQSRLVG
jgi:excisionase family DNA binding protein